MPELSALRSTPVDHEIQDTIIGSLRISLRVAPVIAEAHGLELDRRAIEGPARLVDDLLEIYTTTGSDPIDLSWEMMRDISQLCAAVASIAVNDARARDTMSCVKACKRLLDLIDKGSAAAVG